MEYKNIKVLLDEKGELSKMLNVRVYPTSVVVNKAGKAEKVLPGHLEKAEIKKLFSSKMMMDDKGMKDTMKKDNHMMNDGKMKDSMMKDDKMMNDKHMMKDDKMSMEKKTSM